MGDVAGHVADERNKDAGLAGRAGAGREQDAFGLECLDLVDGELVVTANYDFCTQLAKVLDKVVGEGIVVVEDEDHGLKSSVARHLRWGGRCASLVRASRWFSGMRI